MVSRLYSKNLVLRIKKFTTKSSYTSLQLISEKKSILPHQENSQKPFMHRFFSAYKLFFTKNKLPLVGNIPSYYLSDIKPVKSWKFLSVFPKSGEIDTTHVRIKPLLFKLKPSDFKQTVCKRVRLRLVRSFVYKDIKTPVVTKNILNFKTTAKKFSNFKPSLKRLPAPIYISKWKTSYPLMFTNNAYANKLLKPQLDLTIKTFIQSRNNKRVRRFKKILFRKIKRSSRDKKSIKFTSSNLQQKKRDILLTFSKNRLRSRKSLIFTNTPRIRVKSTTYKKMSASVRVKSKNYIVSWNKRLQTKKTIKCRYSTIAKNTYPASRFQIRTNILLQIKFKFLRDDHKTLSTLQSPTSTSQKSAHPFLRPRTDKNFIFKNFGMFLTSFMLFNQKKPFTYKYLFKKKIFSFLYPNEVRNALMARKKRIVFYQLVYKIKHKSKQKLHYSFASFNKFFINHYKTSLHNTANASITQGLFNGLSTATAAKNVTSSLPNYVSSRDEILYDQNFSYRGVDLSFKRSEVKIPRVRFRPGYQRMWRNARNALKESMGLKFVYQQQLTRCLVRFYRNSNKYSFARSEMSANRIIMYSRLLPDNPTVNLFIDQKLIYINGKLLHTQQMILVPNDLVQLIVSVWYYIAYRWISNWTLKRHKKFKKLVYRKGLAGKHKVMKLKKQRSYYTPNWIYLARYDISDIKPFLEVDYFTLSAFVLYEPFTTYYYTPDESPDFRPNIYRMYNWKYIT